MIEGLKIDVPSGELIDHLKERARFHDDKRVFYGRQADALIEGGVHAGGASNDPTASLQASARTHAMRADFFQFLADHAIADEVYRLTENDMTRIELIGQHL